MCYQGNKTSAWRYANHLFLVLWKELLSWSSSVKQLVGVLLPRDLFVSMNSVQPTASTVYIVSAFLAIAIVVTMELEIVAAVQASLLLKCGDIELNPGPLGREDLEKVDSSHILTEEDFHSIYSELVTIKANYYQLGIGLGLPPGELLAIRKGAQDIEQGFAEVLLAWLRCCQNIDSFGPPTWHGLVEAVDSPAGGNNPKLAMDIAARHPATSSESVNHPHSNTCLSVSLRKRPNQMDLPHASDHGARGIPAKRTCMRLVESGQPSSSESTPPSLNRWKQLLIDFYLASHDLSDAWPPLKTVQFVQLALVQQKDNAQHIGLKTVTGDVDAVYGHKTNTNFFDLFKDIRRSSLYLLEGRPGSGKTTLMIHVTRQWAEGKILTSQSTKLVFLVQLRRLGGRDNIDLKDLLQAACSDFSTEDMQGILEYINTNRGEGVVFALDGFDEYASGQNPENFISMIIMKKMFCRSIVIVSSRPAATRPFRHIASKYIEVVGFFKEQVIQYINCFFEQSEEVEKVQQLRKHLEQHPILMNLCYLPLHCAMLVFLYEQGNATLPMTETEFYRDFTLSILIRCFHKQSKHTNFPQKLRSFDCLPYEEKKVFDRICKLAFQATIASKQIFEKMELDQIFVNDSTGDTETSLGLVVIDRYFVKYGIDETYTFLHLTLQEFLTAVYIAGLSESDQTTSIITHRGQKHLHVTWRFLLGMLDYSEENTVKLFKLILDATCDDHLLHIQCAYESHHIAACTDVLHFHENVLEFGAIGPFDLACITYLLKTAEYTTIKLIFTNCEFSADDAVALLKGVRDNQLSLTINGGEAVQSVLDALSLVTVPGLIELYLDGCLGGRVTAKNNLKLSANLHKLKLVLIDITDLGFEEGFKHWPNLEELYIEGANCPLTVLEAIKHCTNLVNLTLNVCNLDVTKARLLEQSLKYISKLHTISLQNNQFSDDRLQALFDSIKNCEELKHLDLRVNHLTDKSIPYLTGLIKSARNLEKLHLGYNQFTPGGEEKMKEEVRERNSVGEMTELELSDI